MQDFQEDEKKNHDRIMLVEDDTTITRVLKRQLERWGYEVFDTVDFDRVMENFAKWKPDLVLMDLTLPFFNGYYWCSEIGKSTLLCRKRDIGSDRSRSALQGERAEAVRK